MDAAEVIANQMTEKVADGRARILGELRKVIVGQDEVVDQVLMALFTGGHVLITGVPGLAKTLLIKTLAEILDLTFKRIQFTPDLMPSDITGTEILDDAGRPMVLINWNTDMGDGWEWSNAEDYPGYIKFTAEAYRMGINEIVYALTH